MSTHLYVLCRSDRAMARTDLVDWLVDSALLDDDPVFLPPMGDPRLDETSWEALGFSTGPAAVTIERIVAAPEVAEVVDESLDQAHADNAPEALLSRLQQVRQVFHFDVRSPTDDVWEALDALESMLCRELDGIVQSDEGWFDEALQPLADST